MPRMRPRAALAALAVIGLIAVLGLAAARLATAVVPDVGGTYVEGLVGSPNYINPILSHYNPVDQDIVALVFSGLTTTDPHGVVIPDLAERWEISDDGLRYTFYLRKDVRWHDGAPFTSTDVKFTLQAIQDPGYQGPPELGDLWRPVAIDTPDLHTVVFTLPEPFAPFLEYTTQPLIPSHVLSTVAPDLLPTSQFNAQPVGTGPYRVADTTASYVVLEANRDYYGPRPHIARIQFTFYPDRASLLAAYRRGEVAGIGQLLPEELKEVKRDSRLNLYTAPFAGYAMVFLNLERPCLQDPVVRRALWQAIDRQGLIDRFLDGQGLVVHGPILPDSWAFDPEAPKVEYNPVAAAEALEAAGWHDDGSGVRSRDGVRLEFGLLTNNDDPVRTQMIEEIARQWAAIGVRATPSSIEMTALVRDRLYARDYDAVLYGWNLPAADPDPYPLWHSSQATGDGQNYVGYRDPQSDAIMEQARRIADRNQRRELYREFQRRFAEQAPGLVLYQPVYNYAVSRQVHGVQITPLLSPGDRFRTVCDWFMATRRVLLTEATAVERRRLQPPGAELP
ncbi:MAG: ABC transporter substrate-binding protein [Anaerolineae bacterium]|nr:ABC transporter substrate-binding protein [Anaerolineae bacterium]